MKWTGRCKGTSVGRRCETVTIKPSHSGRDRRGWCSLRGLETFIKGLSLLGSDGDDQDLRHTALFI